MDLEKVIDKLILGKSLDEQLGKVPSLDESVQRHYERLVSKYPLRILGTGTDSAPVLTEELRASHIHILGTTREGKSKFLELLIRHDIDNGYGATLLDPSDNGQTAYDVLRYCISKGFEKVCLIDPHDAQAYIPTINPLVWRGAAATDSVVSNLMESVRLLWGQTNFDATPRIETYLYAIFVALYATGNPHVKDPNNAEQFLKPLNCGIPDAVCFSVKEHPQFAYRRRRILDFLHPVNESRAILEEVFNAKGQQLFLGEFKASIRRLAPFFKYLPTRMYSSSVSSIDFKKLVSEKWIILVNLDDTRVWGTPEQRVLGTLIVNGVISAVADLRASGWQGRHYLYIDEAGQFATRALAKIMALKGKSGLWATLSHQFYNQFEDKYVLDAVENLCKIKVLFNTPNTLDRNRMIRDMYTGSLTSEASDAHIALKKQHAVIKIGKEPPVSVRIADIPNVQISSTQLEDFKTQKIYQANSWYRTAESIQEEINNRFALSPTPAGTPPKERRPPGSRINPKGTIGEPSAKPSAGQDKSEPERESIFDDIPGS